MISTTNFAAFWQFVLVYFIFYWWLRQDSLFETINCIRESVRSICGHCLSQILFEMFNSTFWFTILKIRELIWKDAIRLVQFKLNWVQSVSSRPETNWLTQLRHHRNSGQMARSNETHNIIYWSRKKICFTIHFDVFI